MKSFKNIFIAIFLLCGLSACSNWTSTKSYIPAEQYDPAKHARLRLIGWNGNPAIAFVGSYCKAKGGSGQLNVGGFDDAIGSAKDKIVRIGMPETKNSREAEQKELVYREFVIPADEAITFIPTVAVTSWSCPGNGQPCHLHSKNSCTYKERVDDILDLFLPRVITNYYWSSFIPKAGQDYEFMGGSCRSTVSNISSTPIETKVYQCRDLE